jgi:hypothetical protein
MQLLHEGDGLEYSHGKENVCEYKTSKEELHEDLLECFGNIEGINQEDTSKEAVYLFFSFDLVDSTSFKVKPGKAEIWPLVITHFYELIQSGLRKILKKIIVWKYLGDEILLYLIIKNIDEIYESPCFTYQIQSDVMEILDKNFHIKSELDIKSTIWIAGITTTIPSIKVDDYKNHVIKNDSIFRNIEFSLSNENGDKQDFLGQDIDVGFRIAKYAHKNKVTISAGLAYLLNRMNKGNHQNIDKNIKIVSFEYLKGIWNNRAYPIIWYYPNWKSIMTSFDYDEHKNNEIINSIRRGECQDIDTLESILEQLGYKQYHDKFNQFCRTLNKKDDTIEVISAVQ